MQKNGIKIVIVLGLLAAAYGLYAWLGGTAPQVLLANGKMVSGEAVRTPIRAGLIASKVGGQVFFALKLTDADGQAIKSISLPWGTQPQAKVTIIDERGTLLNSGTFRYG